MIEVYINYDILSPQLDYLFSRYSSGDDEAPDLASRGTLCFLLILCLLKVVGELASHWGLGQKETLIDRL